MDSLQKRVGFLEAVVEGLGLQEVACVHARAEEGARDKAYREKFDLAVSRAVAALPVLAEYTLPFVKKGGFLVALKGAKYAEDDPAGARGQAGHCDGEEGQAHPQGLPPQGGHAHQKTFVIFCNGSLP